MIAVHFGAGNIGRGFIGGLLSQAGYEVIFLDVNDALIRQINQQKSYQIVTAEDQAETLEIKNISGINSQQEELKTIQAIAQADIITTAVGPHILQYIAPLLAQGLKKRVANTTQPLNVIACENMLNSTQVLKQHVLTHCTPQEKEQIRSLIGFPNAVVDRIVPNQQSETLLQVTVEPYFEWVVDNEDLKGEKPPIEQIEFVDNFAAYVNRKLYTVNTGHAVIAYTGYLAGYQTVVEAINVEQIKKIVHHCLAETSQLLTMEYDFDKQKHQQYVERILGRFHNPYISDELTRVARSPLRKLNANDRLLGPAIRLSYRGISPDFLAKAIAAALHYDYPSDPEAVQLQARIKQDGLIPFLVELSGLSSEHPLITQIKEQYTELIQ